MDKFVHNSEVCLDIAPPSISSTAANIYNTPAELRLKNSHIFDVDNLDIVLSADIVADASDTFSVTARIIKTDSDGVDSTLGETVVALAAADRGQNSVRIRKPILNSGDTLRIETETTTLGVANYKAFVTMTFKVPFTYQVKLVLSR